MGYISTLPIPAAQHFVVEPQGRTRRIREDGWTPERQQAFLRATAEGSTIERACASVGLSVSSAYAFRNRAAGAAFALGWAAARLLARERIADTLLTRALDGQTESFTRSDGVTVERLKYDNRLALGLLTRLDRQVESNAAVTQAARLIAGEFEAFTDAIGRDDSPARAGLFLGARVVGQAKAADIEPMVALARADRFARAGGSLATEIDIRDLDLSARADWTAEQWARAEAAGLLTLAPAAAEHASEWEEDDESGSPSPLPQLNERDEGVPPVWEDPDTGALMTDFPPPDGFAGYSLGEWGDDRFERHLTPEEEEAWYLREPDPDDAALAEARAGDAHARDLFFGFVAAADPLGDGEDGADDRG